MINYYTIFEYENENYFVATDLLENFTKEQKLEFEKFFKLENDPRITKVGNILRKNNSYVLSDFGLQARKTRAVVVAMDNATTARKAIIMAKSIAPRVAIFARARTLADSQILLQEKINAATPETIESSFFLGYSVLDYLGVSEMNIAELLEDMRANNYMALSTVISDRQ